MNPAAYNRREIESQRLTWEQISALVAQFQADRGLDPDGKLGPATRAALRDLVPAVPGHGQGDLGDLVIDEDGWLQGPGVVLMPADPSWYYKKLSSGQPIGIMAHYTATDWGTAASMARRRTRKRRLLDRAASWHVTIAHDGTLYQMVPFCAGGWHCARGKVADVDGHTHRVNRAVIGVELEGHGDAFPDAQVNAACRLWRALITAYSIRPELAMLEHSKFDPKRRRDPGPVWMRQHAPRVLQLAKNCKMSSPYFCTDDLKPQG